MSDLDQNQLVPRVHPRLELEPTEITAPDAGNADWSAPADMRLMTGSSNP